MNRRNFTKALATVPLTTSILQAGTVLAQTGSPAQSAAVLKERKTAAAYNRHPPVHESAPFAEALDFRRQPATARVRPMPLGDVSLDGGAFADARKWNREYILRLPNDRLLHNFRVTAGLPSTATPLGGWEAPTQELRGHFVGHYLSAAGLLVASTGDPEVRQKADGLVAGIAECQNALHQNGYVSAFPVELFDRLDRRQNVWAPFYTLHKIMAGLLVMQVSASNAQAGEVLLGMAGWVDAWTASMSEEHMQQILQTEYGGMNDVLYELAQVTGDDRWAKVGDRFTKKEFFGPLAIRQDDLFQRHANTHMPQVIGAARRYELSSDPRFRDVSEFFWETVTEGRSYATGGSGNTESWLTHANDRAAEIVVSSHHQECCCAYNMMKLTRHLYAWSGDARYMDYYEHNLLNHRMGTIQPGTGHTTYFLSLSPGAWKTLCTEDDSFWCCTGTAIEEFSKLQDTIYWQDDEALYVNLYAPSTVKWASRGVTLRQNTRFPAEARTELVVESTQNVPWTLKIRMPVWADLPMASINGRPIEVIASPGSYLSMRRTWRAGDRVALTLPMRLKTEPLPDDPSMLAVLYGPLVLAGQYPKGDVTGDLLTNQGPEIQEAQPLAIPLLSVRDTPVQKWLKPVQGEKLLFRTAGQSQEILFRPLQASWDRFVVYWRTV
jgi:DUF1680 family protein